MSMHVCRLSHYLFSVTVGCGMDLLDKDLIDFQKAPMLSPRRQNEIFHLAYFDFSPNVLINKTLFYDDSERVLDGAAESAILTVEEAKRLLFPAANNIPSHITLAGRKMPITQVLVFSKVWIENSYVKPLKKNRSLKRIVREDPNLALSELADRLHYIDYEEEHYHQQQQNELRYQQQQIQLRLLQQQQELLLQQRQREQEFTVYQDNDSLDDDNIHTIMSAAGNSSGGGNLAGPVRNRRGSNTRARSPRLSASPAQSSRTMQRLSSDRTKDTSRSNETPIIAQATPVNSPYSFQIGQLVLLANLQNETMNGNAGLVESFVAGRVNVRLSQNKVVSVKPENLELAAELLD